MGAYRIGELFRVGVDILKITLDSQTRTVLAQLGDVIGEKSYSDKAELWQQVGFCSLPSEPVAGQAAAQAVALRTSKNDVIVATRDLRGQTLKASLGPGETAVYAAGPDGNSQGRMLIKGNGNVVLYTTHGNTPTGTSVTIQCNADGSLVMASEYGGITINSSGITIAHTSGSGIQLDASGATIIGSKVALNGGSIAIGAAANPATPALVGPTGVAGVASTSVFVSL